MKPAMSCLALILLAAPAGVSAQGALDSGGGTRGTATIQVRDAVGMPAAGHAANETVQLQSGFIPGLPAATPVDLTFFSIRTTDEGVVLVWEGNSERRLFGFYLHRAVTRGGEPADAEYVRVDARFPTWGPHRYVDAAVEAGFTYFYRLEAVWADGGRETYGPWSIAVDRAPRTFATQVLPAQPNPFRDAVVIRFSLAAESTVSWALHDVQGRRVTGGAYGRLPAGYHAYTIRPMVRLASGIYFLHVRAGSVRDVQKLVNLP